MSAFDEELSRLVRELNSLSGAASLPALERDVSGRLRIDQLLRRVRDADASDLLLVADVPPTARVDGRLIVVDPHPLDARTVRALVGELLDDRLARQVETRLALDFCFERSELGRFRCNVHHQRGSLAAAIRTIPTSVPELADLGIPSSIDRFASLERGLVLLAGPAGCGKTTTLAALVGIINRTRNAHVITIEDPVEYVHVHGTSIVEQIEVGRDTPSFASALRSAVRQDPDVLCVGEMRDVETAAMVLTAAETGHLVFSTLHTGTVAQTIDRIVDMFADDRQPQIRSQLSLTLAGIVIQHLIPRREGRGRVPAVEILTATDAVRNLVRRGQNDQLQRHIGTGRASGMLSLDESLARLVKAGTIDKDEAARRAVHPEELDGYLR